MMDTMTTQPEPLGADWRRHFWPATLAWFDRTFTGPTPVQVATWDALAGDGATDAAMDSALVVAPTGSGKTLAAFLMSIDKLARAETTSAPRTPGVRVLYVSPLKALAVDIERNLRRPLAGIELTAGEMGLPVPAISVAVRSGDTTPADRRRLLTHPPDILITTPESLFLMLSSQAADTLTGVETVIVDEIHSLAGTKRGAHLAVSLERLDAKLRAAHHPSMRRIGLSATARPATAIAEFLGGGHVAVIAPETSKQWTLDVRVPVADMANLPPPPVAAGDATEDQPAAGYSIWPHVENAILDLVLAHRSTICFVNSRMVAERLTAHLNYLAAARLGLAEQVGAMPSVYAATHNVALPYDDADGSPAVARAHHGSLSKERRAVIEDDLKQGRLRCVVATSSLELGIDMGFVDLVIQTGSPPSVVSGLQRVGRAGHQVGVTSHGTVFPTSRADLLETAVVVSRMTEGLIEAVPTLSNPLDVLAQQVVSMCLDENPHADEVFETIRRAQPFSALPRPAFDAVLDMLTGRYPSEDFAELRPRLTRDSDGCLAARPGSRQLVTTSGGTIPDRGLYGVFLTGEEDQRHGARRVGELDEEMVFETRLGDVITLGSSSWRVEAITPHQVQVTPAPGVAGRLPFWHGDSVGRPAELGSAIGAFVRTAGEAPEVAERALSATGFDPFAMANLLRYIADQKRATGVLPSDKTVVLERFRDELGDWRVCVHAPFGLRVLRPWMLAVQNNLAAAFGADAKVALRNDGAIWRIPHTNTSPPGAELLAVPPNGVDAAVRQALAGSSLFAAHFRECAARALLLPRRRPGNRTPLWAQRLRAGQLLEVASGYKDFPIVVEAMRECLDDVFDMPALRTLLAGIANGQVRLVEVETAAPSPFARSLQFGYVGEFVYDADQPLAERRGAALDIDPTLLTSLLGSAARPTPPDPAAVASVEADWQRLRHPAGSAEALWDMLRVIGPLTAAECQARCSGDASTWLAELAGTGRAAEVGLSSIPAWAVADDLTLILAATSGDATARRRLATRWLRCHVIVRAQDIDHRYGWGLQNCETLLADMAVTGDAVSGFFDSTGKPGVPQYAVTDAMKQVARRQAKLMRDAIKPVPAAHLASFLAAWHGLLPPQPGFPAAPGGLDGLLRAVDQLAGWPLPASTIETLVLPARVSDYQPSLLDEALMTGLVTWSGAGTLGEHDGWVRLWPGDVVLTDTVEAALWDGDPAEAALLAHLQAGGAWRPADLGTDADETQVALWRLAWAGLVTSDSFAPVRDFCRVWRRRPTVPTRVTAWRRARPYLPALAGRWSALRPTADDPTTRWTQTVRLAAERHGIVTRGALLAEQLGYSTAYKILAAMEERGQLTRGYFVAGAGAAQFAVPGAVDQLRNDPVGATWVLAATDPANPYGVAVDWPATRARQPARRAGAVVVLTSGRPICFLERGARTLLTFAGTGDDELSVALDTIGRAIDDRRLNPCSLTRIDDQPALRGTYTALLEQARFRPTPQGFVRRPAD